MKAHRSNRPNRPAPRLSLSRDPSKFQSPPFSFSLSLRFLFRVKLLSPADSLFPSSDPRRRVAGGGHGRVQWLSAEASATGQRASLHRGTLLLATTLVGRSLLWGTRRAEIAQLCCDMGQRQQPRSGRGERHTGGCMNARSPARDQRVPVSA
ncbi:hypothetical protein PVAP13_5KG000800 [Panicum virgatum]|uniref:Uncharacterized protein n=1 Tax=Panicum virgatum TaxID=38727 RepID=A0A8T0SAM3_PANVG|nr:hypothetical protein PVAP13_5KG000800 [Panicum virgatum]